MKLQELLMLFSAVWALCSSDSTRSVVVDTDGSEDNVRSQQTALTAVYKFINFNTRKDCEQSWCLGKDCVPLPDNRKCTLCTCPIGSTARGCDKMPQRLYRELMDRGCPHANSDNVDDRYPATKQIRYFRKIVKQRLREASVDECVPYEFPYCADLDLNMWNSPKTKKECEQVCFWSYPEPEAFTRNDTLRNYEN